MVVKIGITRRRMIVEFTCENSQLGHVVSLAVDYVTYIQVLRTYHRASMP